MTQAIRLSITNLAHVTLENINIVKQTSTYAYTQTQTAIYTQTQTAIHYTLTSPEGLLQQRAQDRPQREAHTERHVAQRVHHAGREQLLPLQSEWR